MKITDYSKVAENYDKNNVRNDIPRDELIQKLYNKEFTVLDLSCGTGNYLKKQMMEYPLSDYQITWIGIDKSDAMIKKAKEKKLDAELVIGDAADIPLESNSINYIKNRFAFHHYLEKEKAVKEMYRILKPNGVLSILNLNHEYMNYSWVYKYFPSSIGLDNERFLKITDLYTLLEDTGFKVKADIKIEIKKFKYTDIIKEAKNKDMSQLQIITEEEYKKGIHKMEEDSSINTTVIGDIAFTEIYAEK